jgi:peroxiredoxin
MSGAPRRARGTARAAVAGIVLSLGIALAGCEDRAAVDLEALGTAPDFVLPLLGGGEVALAQLRGRTVILDFWATWCAPCEVQMPILDALWRDRKDDRLMIVGVSVDVDPPATVADWIDERGFGYPIALGDQALAMRYGLLGFPALVLIDPEGRIQARHTGVWSREEIEARLEAMARSAVSSPPPGTTKSP